MNKICALTLCAALVLCLGAAKPPAKLTREAQVAAWRWGFNYDDIRAAAMADASRMKAFMALDTLNMFDGGSADDYCIDLDMLLRKQGEKAFLAALSAFTPTQQRGLVSDLMYDAIGPDSSFENPVARREWEGFKKQYPQLSARVSALLGRTAAAARPAKSSSAKVASSVVKPAAKPVVAPATSTAAFPLPHRI